ncbi:MAG: hypothetical protein K2X81_13975, partial [Candidatus Obscuribacterales bacterium]|nr:hypothetical protein [Candidatus Obscuribacterales bacterium]
MNAKQIQIAIISAFAGIATLAPNVLAANTVQANVNVSVPSIVSLSGTDGVTTSQNLTLDKSNISFDTNLTASGQVAITWKGNTNSNKGFKVTIQRSALAGTGSTALQNDLMISGAPAPGGDQSAQILGTYASGISLPSIPDSKPDDFCSTNAAGSATFNVQLGLNAPSSAGLGSVNTVLT